MKPYFKQIVIVIFSAFLLSCAAEENSSTPITKMPVVNLPVVNPSITSIPKLLQQQSNCICIDYRNHTRRS